MHVVQFRLMLAFVLNHLHSSHTLWNQNRVAWMPENAAFLWVRTSMWRVLSFVSKIFMFSVHSHERVVCWLHSSAKTVRSSKSWVRFFHVQMSSGIYVWLCSVLYCSGSCTPASGLQPCCVTLTTVFSRIINFHYCYYYYCCVWKRSPHWGIDCSKLCCCPASVPFSPWTKRVTGGREEWVSRDPVPLFSVGGRLKQYQHGQGCRLLDIVRPGFHLLTAALPIIQGALQLWLKSDDDKDLTSKWLTTREWLWQFDISPKLVVWRLSMFMKSFDLQNRHPVLWNFLVYEITCFVNWRVWIDIYIAILCAVSSMRLKAVIIWRKEVHKKVGRNSYHSLPADFFQQVVLPSKRRYKYCDFLSPPSAPCLHPLLPFRGMF